MSKRSLHGFTLVEIAIVIVIVGLLTAGILVGRDLIRASQVRSVIAQIESYDAAIGTFRTKFNCLPGDCNNATTFGLGESSCPTPYSWPGGAAIDYGGCNGNGNRQLDWNGSECYYCPEVLGFWYHLASAKLIPGSFDGKTPSPDGAGMGPFVLPEFGVSAPLTKYDNMGVDIFHFNKYILGIDHKDLTSEGYLLWPADAYTIDLKMDDGQAYSGKVHWESPIMTNCVSLAPTVQYRMNNPNGRCGIGIKMAGF